MPVEMVLSDRAMTLAFVAPSLRDVVCQGDRREKTDRIRGFKSVGPIELFHFMITVALCGDLPRPWIDDRGLQRRVCQHL
jgi:hypothetical protein